MTSMTDTTPGGVDELKPFALEKIIFIVDLSNEAKDAPARKGDPSKRQECIRQAIKLFIQSKYRLHTKHEYAIMTITETAAWAQDFTNNVELLINKVHSLPVPATNPTKLNMTSVFDLLKSKTELRDPAPTHTTPEFIYRAVFVYLRSNMIPQWTDNEKSRKELTSHPDFTFDAIFMYEKNTLKPSPQDVFDFITAIESVSKLRASYYFENGSNPRRLYVQMIQLLAHPLQRPEQKNLKAVID